MKKSNSEIQMLRLLEAMDKWKVNDDDRDNLLCMLYAFGYEFLKALYKSQMKRNEGIRNGR